MSSPSHHDEKCPQVLVGVDADLNAIRDAIQNKAAPFGDDEEAEKVLYQTECKFNWSSKPESKAEEEVQSELHDSSVGTIVVSTERLLFFAATGETHDVAVDAECIHLHAMSNDPLSVYVQMMEPGPGNDGDFSELTLLPQREGSDAADDSSCQELFDALSQLVSLHPVIDDDDDGEGDDDNMMFVASPLNQPPRTANGVNDPTEEERQAMLDRLDNLLVVPPEYEIQDGQFDDADEEEEEEDDDPLL